MAREGGNLTIRMDDRLLARLDAHGRRARETKSHLAKRYIAEGMEMDDHPGIVFRDGPGGRRPGLASGPDVWQVIAAVQGSGEQGDAAVARAAEWLNLRTEQVRAAVRYYAARQEDIDDWIRRNDEEAEAAEAAWLRERELLG